MDCLLSLFSFFYTINYAFRIGPVFKAVHISWEVVMIRKIVVPIVIAFLLMSCAIFTPKADATEAVSAAMTEMAPTVEAQIAESVAATVNALAGPSTLSGAGTYTITEPFSATLLQIAGPMSGDLERTDEEFVAEYCADVNVADFMLEATFTNPVGVSTDVWNYGIFFRDEGQNDQLRLIVYNGNWYLYQGVSDYLNTGYASYYKDSGMSNLVQLYVKDSDAYLYMNGQQQAEINVGQYSMGSGDVCVIGWLYNGDPLYYAIPFEGFSVWEIQ
jgi:hypothetical protein